MKKLLLFAAVLLVVAKGVNAQSPTLTAMSASPMVNGRAHFLLGYYATSSCPLDINMALMQGPSVKDGVYVTGKSGSGTIDTSFVPPYAATYSIVSWALNACGDFITADTMWVSTSTNVTVQELEAHQNKFFGTCVLYDLCGRKISTVQCMYADILKAQCEYMTPGIIYVAQFIEEHGIMLPAQKILMQQ